MPAHPRCDECTLATKKLCPSRRVVIGTRKTKARSGVIKTVDADMGAVVVAKEEKADIILSEKEASGIEEAQHSWQAEGVKQETKEEGR